MSFWKAVGGLFFEIEERENKQTKEAASNEKELAALLPKVWPGDLIYDAPEAAEYQHKNCHIRAGAKLEGPLKKLWEGIVNAPKRLSFIFCDNEGELYYLEEVFFTTGRDGSLYLHLRFNLPLPIALNGWWIPIRHYLGSRNPGIKMYNGLDNCGNPQLKIIPPKKES